ncbi:hypothetical protein WHZ76_26110 [Citrobacter portucalensis]|uniref:hypothetical protein n=1 Tax=Citrobacter portucalensis TaxID=1639133 RepID=UPI00339BF783
MACRCLTVLYFPFSLSTPVRHVLHKINEGLVDPLMANRIIPLDEDERLEVDDA